MNTKGIGGRIQQLRRSKGLTQNMLAESIDISVNYLSNIETGKDVCSTTVLLNIANLLGASIDYIFGDELQYNAAAGQQGEAHAALLHAVGSMTERECRHLLKYVAFMQQEDL